MADASEMVVADPDAPTDKSAKQALMSLPQWEEWLRDHGFKVKTKAGSSHRFEADRWERIWPEQGRIWHIRVFPASDTIHVCVYNNPDRNRFHQLAVANVSERSVPKVVQALITEIERDVSDFTKKRRIKAYTKSLPYEDRLALPLPVHEAAPRKRPVPDDPAELDKENMDALLDRLQARCFQVGSRVKIRRHAHSRMNGLSGTVVSSNADSCYVELDSFVAAGDPDPFRFEAHELESLHESQEDDNPESYLAAMDYVVPLKQAGYTRWKDREAEVYRKEIFNGKASLAIKLWMVPNEPTKVIVHASYIQGGEADHMVDATIDAIDVVDRVRELEELFMQSTGAVDYTDRLRALNHPDAYVNKRRDHLIYIFGESMLEPDDPDNPQPYLDELGRHADLINVFRAHGVRMGRRMTADKPYYRMFYIPSAVADASYDIYLEPQGDGSWTVTAEGLKEFQDQRGQDFVHEFDIDSQWNIPAGTAAEAMNGIVDDLLSELRSHTGPEEAPISEPDVDDIDEGIDDPPQDVPKHVSSTQDAVAAIKEVGYNWTPDAVGKERWQKFWPLPQPVKRAHKEWSIEWTHLWGSPDPWGQYVYALVAQGVRNSNDGSYIVVQPVKRPNLKDDADYATSVRRMLLKIEVLAKSFPVTNDADTMRAYVFDGMRKIQQEVNAEASPTWNEGHVAESIDDPEPMLKRVRAAKMGDIVTVICPNCGDTHQAAKNWPDNAPSEWGFPCGKCGRHIPLTHTVIESVGDPDAMDHENYANSTLNVPELLTAVGYRHDALGPVEHWMKHITPKLIFVVFYEYGVKWNFQVWDPSAHVTGHWRLVTSSNNRDIRTMKADLEKWEAEGRAGTLLKESVNESEEITGDEAANFAKTTYDSEAFLAADGWVRMDKDNAYHFVKTFPTPIEYHLGNMVFTGVQARIHTTLDRLFHSVYTSTHFVARDGTGFPITAKQLTPQLLFAWNEPVYPPDNHLDTNMPIRRFATGVAEVLRSLKWPENKHAAVLANSQVKQAVDALVDELNVMAKEPLHPALEEDLDDPEPEAVLNELPERSYVLITRSRAEDEDIAEANFPGQPLYDQLKHQLERELDEAKFTGKYEIVEFQVGHENEYYARVAITGYGADVDLYWDLIEAFRTGMAGEFQILQYRGKRPEAKGGHIDEALDPDDPQSMLQSHPGFHFQHTSFMGENVYVKEPGDHDEEWFKGWPQPIGNVVQGPGQRWYVINIRGIPQYDLIDYNLGGVQVGDKVPRSFDEKEQAAMAIWLVRQQMEEVSGVLGKKRRPKRK